MPLQVSFIPSFSPPPLLNYVMFTHVMLYYSPGHALATQLEQLLAHPSQKQPPQGESVVEKWFQLTRIAGQTRVRDQLQAQGQGQGQGQGVASSALESVCRMEITANTIILQQKQ